MTTVLTGGTVWDGTGASLMPDTVVIIEGDRIIHVGSRSTVSIPADAERIDLRGSYIIPGLIDSHNHLGLAADTDILNQIHESDSRITMRRQTCLDPLVERYNDDPTLRRAGVDGRRVARCV